MVTITKYIALAIGRADGSNEEYARCIANGMSEEDAQEEAEADTTCGGNCGNRILSYEWGIVCEDPDRATLLNIIAGR